MNTHLRKTALAIAIGANYEADGLMTDTNKWWLQVEYVW
jgi:hypothetical protein